MLEKRNQFSRRDFMKSSKLDLSPPRHEFGDLPVRPVAIPGTTKLIYKV